MKMLVTIVYVASLNLRQKKKYEKELHRFKIISKIYAPLPCSLIN